MTHGTGLELALPTVQHTLESACRRILGQVDWRNMEELPPSRIMEAVAMLDEGWPPALVRQAVDILLRYGWFREAGIEAPPPWALTDADWDRLLAAAPWGARRSRTTGCLWAAPAEETVAVVQARAAEPGDAVREYLGRWRA